MLGPDTDHPVGLNGVEIIEGFAPIGLVNAAIATWPDADWPYWHCYTGQYGEKLATKDPSRITAACRQLVQRIAALTVEEDCFPDLNLHGAGMHWIREGGHLPLHRDAQTHPLTGWTRRFNAVLFLESCEGGELRFNSGEKIAPQANMLAIFPVHLPHEVLSVTKGERRTVSLFWWDFSPSSGSTSAEWADDNKNTDR